MIVDELLAHREEIVDRLLGNVDKHLDLAALVADKIKARLAHLEGLVKSVARKELAAIEWWGAILVD